MFLGRACAASDIWALGIISLLGCIEWNMVERRGTCHRIKIGESESSAEFRRAPPSSAELRGTNVFLAACPFSLRRKIDVVPSRWATVHFLHFLVFARTQCHPMTPFTEQELKTQIVNEAQLHEIIGDMKNSVLQLSCEWPTAM